MCESLPRLYTDLAGWFHLLTAPEDYAEEADFYWGCLVDAAGRWAAQSLGRCWSWDRAAATWPHTTSDASGA